MMRLSIPLRQALAKLTLPVLFAISFGVVLVGQLDVLVAERARVSLADALAPIYATLAGPLRSLRDGVAGVTGLVALDAENARLRAENERLLHWQAVALALAARNRALEASLHWIPSPAPEFVTARAVADAGGVYARAVLLSTGPNHFIRKGQTALSDGSLVGRVTDVGSRSARVLLITDRNSRIPVLLEGSSTRAMMVGTNGSRPQLIFWSGAAPREGQQVVTAGTAGAFQPDLPVGTVRYTPGHVPEVVPSAALGRLGIVEVVAGGLAGLPAPDPTASTPASPTSAAPPSAAPTSPPPTSPPSTSTASTSATPAAPTPPG
jgi:rod shape-determining protein MreC